MEKLVELVSAYVSCGCDVRTELEEVKRKRKMDSSSKRRSWWKT